VWCHRRQHLCRAFSPSHKHAFPQRSTVLLSPPPCIIVIRILNTPTHGFAWPKEYFSFFFLHCCYSMYLNPFNTTTTTPEWPQRIPKFNSRGSRGETQILSIPLNSQQQTHTQQCGLDDKKTPNEWALWTQKRGRRTTETLEMLSFRYCCYMNVECMYFLPLPRRVWVSG
jgi:hypothetical protein